MDKNDTQLAPHDDAPTYVAALLRRAVAAGLTDLYLLPGTATTDIRGRYASGEVCHLDSLPLAFGTQCTARIKVLAGLLTYRTTTAQDGAIHGLPDCGATEFRVAALPTRTGERVTLRLLHAAAGGRQLDDLGFPAATVSALRTLLRHPTGLLILTGPTGSGKTTTIYAMIRDLLAAGHNPATLISIEDPVECEITGISQVQLRRDDPDWGYPDALRAALRHDVKTLVIGELRDRDVTKVALDAALTGHRVITTYHAGDVAGVYARLLHQDFEPFLVAAALTGVVAQRLLPGRQGGVPVPVAAVLAADDAWREFVMTAPGLSDLRSRAAAIPGADLVSAARRLAEAGIIEEKDVCLL